MKLDRESEFWLVSQKTWQREWVLASKPENLVERVGFGY